MRKKLTKTLLDSLKPHDEKPYEVRDTDLKGLLCRVEKKSGAKTFFYVYKRPEKGTRTRYKIGAFPNLSPDGARKKAQTVAGGLVLGIDPNAKKKADRELAQKEEHSTLRTFLDGRYEPWARVHLKSCEAQLARIRSDYAEQLEWRLESLDKTWAEGLQAKWTKAGLKPRSINRDLQRIQSVLSKAVSFDNPKVLDVHPMKGFKPLKIDKTGRVRFLDADEETALRRALDDREEQLRQARARFNVWRVARSRKPLPDRVGDLLDHLKPLVLVALNTGLRRGELLGLSWGAVNLAAKIVTVTGGNAKSGNTRRIPLNSEALDVLTRWHRRHGRPGKDQLVFPGPDGERMKQISTAWKTLMKLAGLIDFRFHDCRHHFASWLVQKGVDLNTVRELLGHADILMVLRYAHLAPHNLRLAVDKLVTAQPDLAAAA